MESVMQIISSVGFPIACACACGYYIKYISDKNREQIANINATHRLEVEEIVQAINNNTIALTKMADKLEVSKID